MIEKALDQLAPSAPEFGENIMAGIGPDLELPPPSSFAPALLLNGRDRSQHHYELLDAEITRLEDRILELKMMQTRWA